ncbi:hypothetical protein Taro_005350 [Colocasia esculenta]|uniref:Uncharacterized protein n=1 Tax=Colocasia esculenta TaxID=4460 RepID=A0A843TUC0_COLES|nr:hypothetical protein [Colocasia esculenta]
MVSLGRTSTKSAKRHPWRTSPERSPTKRHTSNHRGNTTNCRSNTSRSWETLHQNHHGTVLGKPTRTHQPKQQHTSDLEVAQQQQKRARNSLGRNSHQDNNKQFWETSLGHRAIKRCTSTQRATQQQPEMSTTQFWGNLTSTRTNRERLREHLTRAHNQPTQGRQETTNKCRSALPVMQCGTQNICLARATTLTEQSTAHKHETTCTSNATHTPTTGV